MRRRQNFLLAGVAALALVAGTGLSLAQQNQPSQTGGTQGTAQTQGATTSPSTAGGSAMQHRSGNAGSTAQTNSSAAGKQSSTAQQHMSQQKMGQNGRQKNAGQNAADVGNQSAQNAEQGKMGHGRHGHLNHAAQNNESRHGATIRSHSERNMTLEEHGRSRVNMAHEYRHGERNRFSTAQHHMRGERTQINTAQERNGNLRGLQANTSVPMGHGNIHLTEQQRSEIRNRVIFAGGAPRVDNVDFDVRVGSVVPRGRLHVARVPETLVQIDPQWSGYYYFIYHDEVVVVSPRTMRIVAVMPA